MADKFNGTKDQLIEKLTTAYPQTNYAQINPQMLQFKIVDIAVINFYENKTIMFQNTSLENKNKILKLINTDLYQDRDGHKVYIVYGHDIISRNELENILRKWQLKPVTTKGDSGQSIYVNVVKDMASCDFAIALFTPDDLGYGKDEGADRIITRARENVLFETGMLVACKGLEKVAILRKAETNIPSDIMSALTYIAYNNSISEIEMQLFKRLQSAGINIASELLLG